MNEQELLADCLRRLNRTGVTYYLTGSMTSISPSDRQLGDATGVVAVQADALDKNYLRHWAQELKLTSELERLLSGEIKPKQT